MDDFEGEGRQAVLSASSVGTVAEKDLLDRTEERLGFDLRDVREED